MILSGRQSPPVPMNHPCSLSFCCPATSLAHIVRLRFARCEPHSHHRLRSRQPFTSMKRLPVRIPAIRRKAVARLSHFLSSSFAINSR